MKNNVSVNDLKAGDLIYFHNWGIGGFIFGVVSENEDGLYVWRPKSNYALESVDAIEIIENIEDVKSFALYDLIEFLDEIKRNNIVYNYDRYFEPEYEKAER